MVSNRIEQLLRKELERLNESQQQRVVDFARSLPATQPAGTPISEFLSFAGTIPSEDLREIAEIIDRDCEQIDPNAW